MSSDNIENFVQMVGNRINQLRHILVIQLSRGNGGATLQGMTNPDPTPKETEALRGPLGGFPKDKPLRASQEQSSSDRLSEGLPPLEVHLRSSEKLECCEHMYVSGRDVDPLSQLLTAIDCARGRCRERSLSLFFLCPKDRECKITASNPAGTTRTVVKFCIRSPGPKNVEYPDAGEMFTGEARRPTQR